MLLSPYIDITGKIPDGKPEIVESALAPAATNRDYVWEYSK